MWGWNARRRDDDDCVGLSRVETQGLLSLDESQFLLQVEQRFSVGGDEDEHDSEHHQQDRNRRTALSRARSRRREADLWANIGR